MKVETLTNLCKRLEDKNSHLKDLEQKERISRMLNVLLDNHHWPDLKIGKWLGYIEGILIANNVASVDEERDFTREFYHEHYRDNGIEIPKTTDVMKIES